MGSSTPSASTGAPAPKPSPRAGSSRSPAPSLEAARQASEPRHDFAIPLPVAVVGRAGERRIEYALNLSPSGMALHLARSPQTGEVLQVEFALPDEAAPPIVARGRVVWSETPARAERARFREVGVRFEVLAEADRRRILRFLTPATARG